MSNNDVQQLCGRLLGDLIDPSQAVKPMSAQAASKKAKSTKKPDQALVANSENGIIAKLNAGLSQFFSIIYGERYVTSTHVIHPETGTRVRKPVATLVGRGEDIELPLALIREIESQRKSFEDEVEALKKSLKEEILKTQAAYVPEYFSILVETLTEVETRMTLGDGSNALEPLQELVHKDFSNFLNLLSSTAHLEVYKSKLFQLFNNVLRTHPDVAVTMMAKPQLKKAIIELSARFFQEEAVALSKESIDAFRELLAEEPSMLPTEEWKNQLGLLLDEHDKLSLEVLEHRIEYVRYRKAAELAESLLLILTQPDGRRELEFHNLLKAEELHRFREKHPVLLAFIEKSLRQEVVDTGSAEIKIPDLAGRSFKIREQDLTLLDDFSGRTLDRLIAAQVRSPALVDSVFRESEREALRNEREYVKLLSGEAQAQNSAKLMGSFYSLSRKIFLKTMPSNLMAELQKTLGDIFQKASSVDELQSKAPTVRKELPLSLNQLLTREHVKTAWINALWSSESLADEATSLASLFEYPLIDLDTPVGLSRARDAASILRSIDEFKDAETSPLSKLKLFLNLLNLRAQETLHFDHMEQLKAFKKLDVLDQDTAMKIENRSSETLDSLLSLHGALEASLISEDQNSDQEDALETMASLLESTPQLARVLVNNPGHQGLAKLRIRLFSRYIRASLSTEKSHLVEDSKEQSSLTRLRATLSRNSLNRKAVWFGFGTLVFVGGTVTYVTVPEFQEYLKSILQFLQ